MKSLFIAVLSCAPFTLAVSQTPADSVLTTHLREIAKNPNSSWAHYSLAELLLQRKHYSEALNEFRAALRGDKQPAWVQVWSYIHLGKIFAATGQRERAIQEFQQALATGDNTRGALDEAGSLLKAQLAQARGNASVATFPVGEPVALRDLPQWAKTFVSPTPLHQVEAVYSAEGQLAGLEGTVRVRAVIAEDGIPSGILVKESLGLGLDEQAVEAVKQWRFPRQPYPIPVNLNVDFTLPLKQSRWHLVKAQFQTPEGAARPVFSRVTYPRGSGVSEPSLDQGRIVAAIRRSGAATILFDVNESGTPSNIRKANASHEVWGREAAALVRDWQFIPASKNGAATSVLCVLTLIWREKNLSPEGLREFIVPATAIQADSAPRPPQPGSQDATANPRAAKD